jgi:hypothetical protein
MMPRVLICWLAMICLIAEPMWSDDEVCGVAPNTAKNNISYSMFLLSKPQDASQCSMTLTGNKLVFSPPVSNPALSCPDMVAWKLFAEAIQAGFWRNWAADQQTWPGVTCDKSDLRCVGSKPLALCKKGSNAAACCDPDSETNPGYDDPVNSAKYCPYFPGDHLGPSQQVVPLRVGLLPSKAHLVSFALEPRIQSLLLSVEPEPGRKVRQAMAELVFRNKPMFEYTFRNDLYNQEGLISVFQNHASVQSASAPYHSDDASLLTEIDYPIESVMIKSNWISKERAVEIGLKDDPQNPYVKMNILSGVTDNNGTILAPGEHWLVAFHISSKDIPNWVWATFEHVNNPGRCDYTGCNDSYGYLSPDSLKPGQATNFTAPKTKCDALLLASWVFDTGKNYGGGTRSVALTKILDGLGIGKKDNTSLIPSSSDRAWLSYRLKGAQTQFTDSIGSPTRLGNSITEGGFVSTSSCMTCHSRASGNRSGTQSPEIGVFINELSETGYFQSSRGTPNPDWFLHSGVPKQTAVIQTDFIWGFLSANCLTDKCEPSTTQTSAIKTLAIQAAPPNGKSVTVRSKVQDQ